MTFFFVSLCILPVIFLSGSCPWLLDGKDLPYFAVARQDFHLKFSMYQGPETNLQLYVYK